MKVLMNHDLLDLYMNRKSKKYKEVEMNRELMDGFIRAVSIMIMVSNVNELSGFSYLHYEKLKYQWSGYSSVRLSNRYVHRLIFRETTDGLEIEIIELDNTHYGNKR